MGGAPGEMLAGWQCYDPKKAGIGVPGNPAENCILICKDHGWHTGVAEYADHILMSRRDPVNSLCSRKLMDMWCKAADDKSLKLATKEERDDYNKKCLKGGEVERKHTHYQCHELMKMQASIYFERRSLNLPVDHDVLMEDMVKDPATQIKAVAKGMGICDEAAENEELVAFVVGMDEHMKNAKTTEDQGLTQMHGLHTDAQRKQSCSNLREWMESDPECKAWMDADASIDANAELQKFEENPPKRDRPKGWKFPGKK